jgi:hypothetical protein
VPLEILHGLHILQQSLQRVLLMERYFKFDILFTIGCRF